MRPSRLEPVAVAVALLGGLSGCGAPAAGAPQQPLSPPAPVASPLASVTGCVESPELRAYVLALDAHRAEARERALAALGARAEQRSGHLGEPGALAPLDQVLLEGERRFAVVGRVAAGFPPVAALAGAGHVLHRIDERPRAHAVPVLSCGERRCASPAAEAHAPSEVRPLLVELGPGERLGAPLELVYDYWWAAVDYASSERCAGQASPAEPTP